MKDVIKVDIAFIQININRYSTRFGLTSPLGKDRVTVRVTVARNKNVWGSMCFPYDKLIEKDPITAQVLVLSSWSFRNTWTRFI